MVFNTIDTALSLLFFTAHGFCTSRVRSDIFGFPKKFACEYKGIFVFVYVEKADLSKGYQKLKRKSGGGITHFSEVIELKFRKNLPYILCILKLFA